LVTREQEVDLARRIENGRHDTLRILNAIPLAARKLAPGKAHDRIDAMKSNLWMLLNEVTLFASELCRLLQNRLRHRDLANVVQQRTPLTSHTSGSQTPISKAILTDSCATRRA
jgi:hypothetical protein